MKSTRTHQSLKRGLWIIEVIAASGVPVTLAEVSRKTVLPRSTAHHLLRALVEFGYLIQDSDTRTYTLTPKLFRITKSTWSGRQLGEIAMPFLEELRRLTGEGTSLAVIRDRIVTVVAKCESEGPVRVAQEVGVTRPIHCTAVGKILAAWLPEHELDGIIERIDFEKKTDNTILSPNEFRREIENIRETGFANDNEEHIKGIRCIAGAVRDFSGEVRAALCVVGPKDNLREQKMEKVRRALNDVALNFSERLGYGLLGDSQDRSTDNTAVSQSYTK